MSIDQRFRDAYADLDDLLGRGSNVAEAIALAADGNGIKPGVFRARAERALGNLEAYRQKLTLRAAWAANEAAKEEAFAKREKEVQDIAGARAEAAYYACDLHDLDPGRPSWPFLIEDVIRSEQLTDARLKQAAWKGCYESVERLDRKHGTHTTHFR